MVVLLRLFSVKSVKLPGIFYSCTIFESYLINSLGVLFLVYQLSQVELFFVEKGNLKLSDSKMLWREESH